MQSTIPSSSSGFWTTILVGQLAGFWEKVAENEKDQPGESFEVFFFLVQLDITNKPQGHFIPTHGMTRTIGRSLGKIHSSNLTQSSKYSWFHFWCSVFVLKEKVALPEIV